MTRLFQLAYMGIIFLFLYIPIAVLIVFSFNNTVYSGLWHGFTWRWYGELFHDGNLLLIAFHSVSIAVLSASLASIIGTIASLVLFQYRFSGRRGLYALLFIMIIIPDLVLAVALLLLFHAFHLHLGFWSLLLAHITFSVPFAFILVYSRLMTLDKNLFQAARDLGARDTIVIRRIILPLLMPGIVAAWLLSFTLSFDDVVISFFVSGPDFQILPLYIYSSVRLGVTPEINALCSIILVLTFCLAVLSQWYLRKKQ